MDDKMNRYFKFAFYFCLLIGFFILLFNGSHRLISLCIYSAFAGAMIWYNAAYRKRPESGKNLLFLLLIPALFVQYFDHTRFVGFSVWILIIYAMLFYGLRLKSPFIWITLFSHIALLAFQYRQTPFSGILDELSTVVVPRVMIMLVVIIAQKINSVNAENKALTDSLRENTVKLESALAQLSAYASELEKTADLRARDKLMHELHDKLGHILTTASIGSQAAVILLDKDIPSAKERMEMVTKQIQDAMKYLRQVISGESADHNETDQKLIQGMKKLILEAERKTGVPIKNNLSELPDDLFEALPVPVRTFLYNALMEGLTNGIRHANPTRFEVLLQIEGSQLRFSVHNDGTAARDIKYGYGLSKMTAAAARFGGTLETSNKDGFMLKISLPVDVREEVLSNG